jgi:hypothetical protein
MAILKLENEGDTMTARIKQAETTAGKFGPQIKFEMENGDVLYISEPTAMRQLARIPLEVGECAGETLVFSRDHNPNGKPYWGIKVASAADKAPPSKRLSYAEAAKPSGPSKGSLPFDEESFPPPTDDDNPYNEPGPIPPFHKPPTKAADTAPIAATRAAYINAYFDLLGYVKAHSGLKDEVAIQAATATLHIGLKQEGLR